MHEVWKLIDDINLNISKQQAGNILVQKSIYDCQILDLTGGILSYFRREFGGESEGKRVGNLRIEGEGSRERIGGRNSVHINSFNDLKWLGQFFIYITSAKDWRQKRLPISSTTCNVIAT